MKRLALLPLAAVLLVGCQESSLLEELPAPSFAWSDATSTPQGNQYFAFLTPIRPTPDAFAAPFNPYADPSVTVYELPPEFDFEDPAGQVCAPSGSVLIDATLSPVVIPTDPDTGLPREEYETGWNTGEDNNVVSGRVYRICVRAFDQEMGWRDAGPQDEPVGSSRDVAQDPIYGFNNGRNIPVAFHISYGAGCSLEENIDCTEVLFEPGAAQVATCDDGLCGGAAQAGTFSEPTPIRIQLVACPRDPATGRITHLGVETDIPLFPGCLEVETLDGSPVDIPASAPFVAGACIDVSPDETGNLSHRQFDLLQLHHRRTNLDGSYTVEALPQVSFAGVLSCAGFEEFASAQPTGLMQLARRGLDVVQEVVSPWFSPPPLVAGDRGVGGEMFGEDAFSPAVWGLPIQQQRGQIVAGGFVPWNDVEIGEVGTPFAPAVRVLDAGTPECHEDDLECEVTGPQPVENATVAFDATVGGGTLDYSGVNTIADPITGETKVVTGSDGIATVALYPTAGENSGTATGVGVGCYTFDNDGDAANDCQITDGVAPSSPVSSDGTGPFGDNALFRAREKVDLATSVTSFNGFACSPRPADLAADGVVNAGEYANSEGFTAKVAGEVPATIHWTNDCTDLYVAVTVATDEEGDNPPLRLVFDNDGDGVEALGDDILFLDRASESVKGTKVYTWSFSDRFLSSDCLSDNAKSDCGDADPGVADGEATFSFVAGPEGSPGLATYEFRHPLASGDVDHDFQLMFGDVTGMYVVFQTGQGPKGGVIYAGLEDYIDVTINP